MEPKREHIYWPLQDFDNLVAERVRMNREEAKEMMLGYFKNARHIQFFTPEQHAEKLCDLLEAYGLFTVGSNTLPIPAHPETVKYDRIDALSEKVKALEGVLNEYRKVTDQRLSGCEHAIEWNSGWIGRLDGKVQTNLCKSKIIPITDKYREGYKMVKWRCKKGKGKKRGR
jgi:polyhydroxyalkanoate synthesis regulator phasin